MVLLLDNNSLEMEFTTSKDGNTTYSIAFHRQKIEEKYLAIHFHTHTHTLTYILDIPT